jgi:hypothetical protein
MPTLLKMNKQRNIIILFLDKRISILYFKINGINHYENAEA